MSVPFEINDVEPGLNAQLLDDFKGERRGFLQVYMQSIFELFIRIKNKNFISILVNFRLVDFFVFDLRRSLSPDLHK